MLCVQHAVAVQEDLYLEDADDDLDGLDDDDEDEDDKATAGGGKVSIPASILRTGQRWGKLGPGTDRRSMTFCAGELTGEPNAGLDSPYSLLSVGEWMDGA